MAASLKMGLAWLASLSALGGVLVPLHTNAEVIAIIGTGNVAQALGPAFAAAGHKIIYGSRSPERRDVLELVEATGLDAYAAAPAAAAGAAEVVVLAVPWAAAEEVVKSLGDLSGKIVIDPTNPRATGADGLRDFAFDGSNAQRIQQWAPTARVVKAFNTMTAGLMENPRSAGGPVTVALAGDDAEAKAVVARLARDIGFETADFGPVRYAHIIEGMYLVWGNARQSGNAFEYHLRRPPAN